MSKPSILVSNDDGIHAPGLLALVEALESVGDVTVVAPDRERSASGHAMSLHRPLRLRKVGPRRFACDGTPTDSVYVGVHHVLSGRLPNVLVSGINMGGNMADDLTYSGTLAAAFEGTIIGIPSVAISLNGRAPWDFDAAKSFARSIAREVIERGLPEGILLNVNIPPGQPKGYRITRQGRRRYSQTIQEREDPRGGRYFWIGGPGQDHENIPLSDCNAVLDDSLISVTPLHLDLTATQAIETMRTWTLDGFAAE